MSMETNEMHSDVEKQDDVESVDDDLAETVVIPESETTDNVGDASVEINVEELIADIEGSDDQGSKRQQEIRRRLEEFAEEQSLDDTYAIDFDKE